MTSSPKSFNLALYGLSQATVIVCMIPGFLPKSFRIPGFALISGISYTLISTQTTGDKAGDFGIGSAIITQAVFAFDYFFLSHPSGLKNLADKNPKKVTERSLKERVTWAFSLYTNPRGIGWAHEPRHLSSHIPPPTTRWAFMRSRLLRLLGYIVIEGVISVINASNPAMTTPGKVLSQFPLPLRALGAAGYGIGGCIGIAAVHTIVSIFAVGTGLSSPEGWLELFGSPTEIWSIQRFWKMGWHQLLRRSMLAVTAALVPSSPSASEAPGTGSSPLTILQKMARLYCTFAVSSFIHVGGEYMLLKRFGTGSIAFFMLQAIGINLEILLQSIWSHLSGTPPSSSHPTKEKTNGKTSGYTNGNGSVALSPTSSNNMKTPLKERPPLWIRLVGYTWVLVWFTWTVPFMIDPAVAAGMFTNSAADLRTYGLL